MYSYDHSSKIYTNDTITIMMAAIKLESETSTLSLLKILERDPRPLATEKLKGRISSSFTFRRSTPRRSDARFVEQRENRISQRFAGIIPRNVGDVKKATETILE